MMAISTKGRYACRIVVLLAGRMSAGPINKNEIARAEGITSDYVQQIMQRLRATGLVRSHRGKVGGFSLARDPQTVSILDVLAAVEGRVEVAPCRLPEDCERMEGCPTRPVWMKAAGLLDDLFGGIRIAELVPGADAAGAASAPYCHGL